MTINIKTHSNKIKYHNIIKNNLNISLGHSIEFRVTLEHLFVIDMTPALVLIILAILLYEKSISAFVDYR